MLRSSARDYVAPGPYRQRNSQRICRVWGFASPRLFLQHTLDALGEAVWTGIDADGDFLLLDPCHPRVMREDHRFVGRPGGLHGLPRDRRTGGHDDSIAVSDPVSQFVRLRTRHKADGMLDSEILSKGRAAVLPADPPRRLPDGCSDGELIAPAVAQEQIRAVTFVEGADEQYPVRGNANPLAASVSSSRLAIWAPSS